MVENFQKQQSQRPHREDFVNLNKTTQAKWPYITEEKLRTQTEMTTLKTQYVT